MAQLAPLFNQPVFAWGILHIISNMWFLWVFGGNVEDRLGFLFFPIFYLLAGVVGNFLQYFIDPTSTIPLLGASGAIAGVLGAYFAFFPNHKVKTLVPIIGFITVVDLPAWVMLIYWFATQLFSGVAAISSASTTGGGVAWFAHIGGFASGWLVGKLLFFSSD